MLSTRFSFTLALTIGKPKRNLAGIVGDRGDAVTQQISKRFLNLVAGFVLAMGLGGPASVSAQPKVSGVVEWGVWIDDDGCMHWMADGGIEGYMVPRRNKKTGKPVCLKINTCLVENTDALFTSNTADLTARGRTRLESFFKRTNAVGYAIYSHTDSRGSKGQNKRLSDHRATAVAGVAHSVGGLVERKIGFGESRPIASNSTAAGMQKNRRVEIVCYRW